MATPGYNLPDVFESIRKRKGLIAVVSVAAALAGAIFYLAGPKKYEAKTAFILRNPLYGDRNNLYNVDTKFIDYFANEDDVNRIILMAEADIMQAQVIRDMDLAKAYGIDTTTRKGALQLERRFNKNLNIMRTEYKALELSYDDSDPERAAAVANDCVKVLESVFSQYYRDMRNGMYAAVADKVKEEDSTITALTDTLALLRDQYGIYDIISPSRYNLMLGSLKENGKKDFGKGVELVQNYESLKDELVSDRAKQTTIINQFKTGINSNLMPMLKVITYAKNPVNPKGLGGMLTVLVCGFLGFFFSTIVALMSDNYMAKHGKK